MAIESAPPQTDLPDARKRRDTRALWRLSGWGGAAVIALTALAFTTQTQSGSERLQLAFAPESQPVRAVSIADDKPRTVENDAATRALEAQVLALAADRDRLNARIASLERNLGDMTGSINRQAAAAPAAESPVQTPAPNTTASVPASAPASVPDNAPATVATAAAPSLPAIAAAPPIMPPLAPLAMPAIKVATASWPEATAAATMAATPAVAAVPPKMEIVPLPPTRLAAAPANDATVAPAHKPEFGVDLGGAPNLEVLGARWAAVKANFGPLLAGMYPLAAHVRRPGATDFRLLVGPLPDTTAATQLCVRFAAAHVTCRPVKFAGERFVQR